MIKLDGDVVVAVESEELDVCCRRCCWLVRVCGGRGCALAVVGPRVNGALASLW